MEQVSGAGHGFLSHCGVLQGAWATSYTQWAISPAHSTVCSLDSIDAGGSESQHKGGWCRRVPCPLSPASLSLNVALGNSMVNGDSFLDQETGHMHEHIYTRALTYLYTHSCTDGHVCIIACLYTHHTYLYTQAFACLFCLQGP